MANLFMLSSGKYTSIKSQQRTNTGEFLVNEVHLEEMIDDYLRELYNKIEIEMENLKILHLEKKCS